jgi:hypothetical protein
VACQPKLDGSPAFAEGIGGKLALLGSEVAGAKGLEPSTSAVTGQRSNQLSYAPAGVERGT